MSATTQISTQTESQKVYLERINILIDYINNHLDEDLDLAKLAQLSNFSVFHFHRIVRAYLNEPIGAYIARIRLETGARLLSLSQLGISEIAWKIGYESPSSFTKAFGLRFGISPTEYRNTRENQNIKFNNFVLQMEEMKMEMKPKIKEMKPVNVIYITSIENYGGEKMQTAWQKLIDFMKKHKLFGFSTSFFGISHDDPEITESQKCRYDSCISISKTVSPEGEIGFKTILGGKYAIFLHKGPYEKLSDAYGYIFKSWLPQSGFKLREEPCIEKYINTPDKTKAENLKTEIFVPITNG